MHYERLPRLLREPASSVPEPAGALSPAHTPHITGTKIGELGERWRFPSDHVPVAACVLGLRLASWNVLNTKWVSYFGDNAQGLARSAIMTENVPLIPSTAWTVRDEHVLQIARVLSKKLDLLLLQECSRSFLDALQSRLPAQYTLLRGSLDRPENDIAAVLATGKVVLDQQASAFHPEGYRCKTGRPIMDMQLNAGAHRIRIVHTHVPGDPKMPGTAELAEYLSRKPIDLPTVVTGDLNFLEEEVRAAFDGARLPPCLNLAHGNTNVGDGMIAKKIDHILCFNVSPSDAAPIHPQELSSEIDEVFRLLNPAP